MNEPLPERDAYATGAAALPAIRRKPDLFADDEAPADGTGTQRQYGLPITRRPLCIWPISDLHLNPDDPWPPDAIPEADDTVVAGDICEGVVAAVEWLARHIRPHMRVVFVAGNHEFYRTVLPYAQEMGTQAAAKAGMDSLNGDVVVIAGVRFIGATLWTDYNLFGPRYRDSAMQEARSRLNDHRLIAWQNEPWLRLRPEEAAQLHARDRRAIEGRLDDHHSGPSSVVTHHAPHADSLPDKFRHSLLSAAYASDLSEVIARYRPDFWLHGHTHFAADYRAGETRIISNPCGYSHERGSIGFQFRLVIEV